MFRQDFSCPALLEDPGEPYPYGAVTRSGAPFQMLPVQFPGFALFPYVFRKQYLHLKLETEARILRCEL